MKMRMGQLTTMNKLISLLEREKESFWFSENRKHDY